LTFTLTLTTAIFGGIVLFALVVAILVSGTKEDDIEKELKDCRKTYVAKKD